MENNNKCFLFSKIIILLLLFLLLLNEFNNVKNNNISFIHNDYSNNSFNINSINNKQIFNVEIIKSDYTSLKLLLPSKQCSSPYPTVYFTSEYRDINKNVVFTKKEVNEKKYYLSFFLNNYNYRHQIFLKRTGFIQKNIDDGKNNLYIGTTNKIKKSNYLSKYIKINQYLNGYDLFQKDSLYKYFKIMKNKFIDDYKYMPETYYYPHDEDIIQNKFKGYHLDINDLWFLKPVNLSGGSGISIFKSLNSIKYNQYVLTKCVTNVHLIKEKNMILDFLY